MLVASIVILSVVKLRVGKVTVWPVDVRDDGTELHRDGTTAVEAQRDAGDPTVARSVQGLDEVDLVGVQRMVQHHPEVLTHRVVERGHGPRGAEVAVEWLGPGGPRARR